MKPKISIQNVVASASINQPINLKSVVRYFPDAWYKPEQFPGLPFKIDNPKSCVLLFESGKMVCTGTKSELEAERAIKKVVQELKRVGIIKNVVNLSVFIQNIVASIELENVMIDIERAIYELRNNGHIMYEPEMFPGAIFRMKEPKVVFLIFRSGKLVCVGAKKEDDVHRAIAKLLEILRKTTLLIQL